MGRKLGFGLVVPLLWRGARAEAYLYAKFIHLDPSNRLATVHQHHRQDRQTGQWSYSIVRTVLQTVAQKGKRIERLI